VTDAATDPDRRAWHLALAAAGPDDAVADELEHSAARARARGGEASAAAFLERAAALTFDPARRAERALAAADAKYLAWTAEAALRLAAVAERGALDEFHRARVDVLRGRVATIQRRAADVPPLLLGAARRLERLDRRLARETYRDAYLAGIFAGRFAGATGLPEVAAAIRSAAPSVEPRDVTDELLDAVAMLIDAGWDAGAQTGQRALANCCVASVSDELNVQWLYFAARMLPVYLWDPEAWDALGGRIVERVRDAGVLALLPMAVAMRVAWELFEGDLAAASALVAEQDTVQEAISGDSPPGSRITLAAFRGRESEVEQLHEAATHDAVTRGDGPLIALLHWSMAVLCNGLGRYDQALEAAQLGLAYPYDLVSDWVLSELVEAAARCGRIDAARGALDRLEELARACGTDWILGVEIRCRALVADPADAEELYRQAIDHLARTSFRTEVARARLLYGEWLRRRGRRLDARAELRTAHRMFTEIGMDAFAERARTELAATGEQARKRTVETRDDLTAQERQIAQLACDGLSNPEIGSRLFLSPRTVEWHLHKVFGKLGIRSRHELATSLAAVTADERRRP
jgi:DNA-binding CsgD family transcriptional regulator